MLDVLVIYGNVNNLDESMTFTYNEKVTHNQVRHSVVPTQE